MHLVAVTLKIIEVHINVIEVLRVIDHTADDLLYVIGEAASPSVLFNKCFYLMAGK